MVDDGSTDDTAEIASSDSSACACLQIDHGGLAVARNEGFRAADGDLVAYLDADAYPDARMALLPGSRPERGRTWAAPAARTSRRRTTRWEPTSSRARPAARSTSSPPTTARSTCPAATWRSGRGPDEVGGFDPVYEAAGDDVDICWRALDRGWKIGFHPAAVVWHHRRPGLARLPPPAGAATGAARRWSRPDTRSASRPPAPPVARPHLQLADAAARAGSASIGAFTARRPTSPCTRAEATCSTSSTRSGSRSRSLLLLTAAARLALAVARGCPPLLAARRARRARGRRHAPRGAPAATAPRPASVPRRRGGRTTCSSRWFDRWARSRHRHDALRGLGEQQHLPTAVRARSAAASSSCPRTARARSSPRRWSRDLPAPRHPRPSTRAAGRTSTPSCSSPRRCTASSRRAAIRRDSCRFASGPGRGARVLAVGVAAGAAGAIVLTPLLALVPAGRRRQRRPGNPARPAPAGPDPRRGRVMAVTAGEPARRRRRGGDVLRRAGDDRGPLGRESRKGALKRGFKSLPRILPYLRPVPEARDRLGHPDGPARRGRARRAVAAGVRRRQHHRRRADAPGWVDAIFGSHRRRADRARGAGDALPDPVRRPDRGLERVPDDQGRPADGPRLPQRDVRARPEALARVPRHREQGHPHVPDQRSGGGDGPDRHRPAGRSPRTC